MLQCIYKFKILMEIKDSMEKIKKHLITKKNAFTLAEVMVVLFVLTVILAAFAPMMTTRTKVNKTSPWTYASPDTANAYFGMGPNQTIMIGQKTKPATDLANRLTVNTSGATQAHMLFKQGTNILGQLNLNNDSVILGGSREAVASGSGNSALGVEALKLNTEGVNNTAIGYQAMLNNATGQFNTAVGTLALSDSTAGNYSTALGYNACDGVNANYTTCIGAFSGPNTPVDGAVNDVYIGNTVSNVMVYGVTELRTLIETSDKRLKNITGENTDGLDKINKIKTYNYTFKNDDKKTPRVGVMAQDLKKIFPAAVTKGQDGYLRIRKDDMFFAMINAIKELAAKDSEKDLKIKALEKKNAELEARLDKLEKMLIEDK